MKKILFFLFAYIIYYLSSGSPVYAEGSSHVLIINQVRGEECCSKGSLNYLKTQVKELTNNNMPSYFALRYDSLLDQNIVKYVKQMAQNKKGLVNPALLLEFTPSLIKRVGLSHDITDDNWFEAQNAYTIGYSHEESRMIIDYLFETFFQEFGFYPPLTSSWMIDTESLNYIREKYGVTVHQITREQYGTDSYTLYGGPPHYPYPASTHWLLQPDYETENPMLIVRQTVTDPLFNYGDWTSTYTSQPNDYMKGDRDFSYFKKLIDQAVFGQSEKVGFINLGLENSMIDSYQMEFVRQIRYLKELRDKGKIEFPSLLNLSDYWKKSKISVYSGTDFSAKDDFEAFWITTESYRIRLIKKNGKALISDIRVYNPKFDDPYNNYQAKKNGYWIVPYLIDGSYHFKKIVSAPLDKKYEGMVRNDFETNPEAIFLPEYSRGTEFHAKKFSDKFEIKYESKIGKNITISFYDNRVEIKHINHNELFYQESGRQNLIKKTENNDGFELSRLSGGQTVIRMLNSCKDSTCLFTFTSSPDILQELRENQYPYLFPEPVERKIDPNKSLFYPHNQFALVNRNPIRMIFSARDKYDLPTIVSKSIIIKTTPNVPRKEVVKNPVNRFIQYVDLYATKPGKYNVELIIDNNLELKSRDSVFFRA